jgi:hypothetical protein
VKGIRVLGKQVAGKQDIRESGNRNSRKSEDRGQMIDEG